MAKKITKYPRKGMTRQNWIKLINQCLAAVGQKDLKIEFTPDGITIDKFLTIGFDEKESKELRGKVLIRGYNLTSFRETYSYIDGPDVVDYEHGFFRTPYDVLTFIAQMYLSESLGGIMEGFVMEDAARSEEKYHKEMEEFFIQEAKDTKEQDRDNYDDYRDTVARHNRQVLSRL